MTLSRASEIEKSLIDHMENPAPKLVADFFTPLSAIGVESRMDIRNALYLNLADFYANLVRANATNMQWKAFDQYLEACSATRQRVLMSFFPDKELAYLEQVQHSLGTSEYASEFSRVCALHDADGFFGSESVGEFANFLRTIDPNSPSYLVKVYERLGLPYSPYAPYSGNRASESNTPPQKGCLLSAIIVCGMLVSLILFWKL